MKVFFTAFSMQQLTRFLILSCAAVRGKMVQSTMLKMLSKLHCTRSDTQLASLRRLQGHHLPAIGKVERDYGETALSRLRQGPLSGCSCTASFRYAARIPELLASLPRPNTRLHSSKEAHYSLLTQGIVNE